MIITFHVVEMLNFQTGKEYRINLHVLIFTNNLFVPSLLKYT